MAIENHRYGVNHSSSLYSLSPQDWQLLGLTSRFALRLRSFTNRLPHFGHFKLKYHIIEIMNASSIKLSTYKKGWVKPVIITGNRIINPTTAIMLGNLFTNLIVFKPGSYFWLVFITYI